jgi:aerobic-type carbon monoxide dehydrogenase small subunit (CoxS/CutS family)
VNHEEDSTIEAHRTGAMARFLPRAARNVAERGARIVAATERQSKVQRLSVTLRVNGRDYTLVLEPRRTLLDALRHDLQLTGTKKVCDMGDCGACTVLVDGHAMYACLLLAVDCVGRQITTIEGLAEGAELDPIQQAFVEADALQCGFCTPGQVMSIAALLNETPHPSDAQIVRALSGNLCRCGAYRNILRAARIAAERRAEQQGMSHADTPR